MKKPRNLATQVLLLTGVLWLVSCQSDPEQANNIDDLSGTSFTASSELAGFIKAVAIFDGSFDNIIDGSSCIALKFPYTVTANGIELEIKSQNDLQLIEDIFDEFIDDTDVLDIHFPITITQADHSEVGIADQDELADFGRGCVEGGDDDDNECVDFVYPFTLFTLSQNDMPSGNIRVESDMQLWQFFNGLGVNDNVSLEYPIKLRGDQIGTESGIIEVNRNEQLIAQLRPVICDEDDDSNFSDDDFDGWNPGRCPWEVISIKSDGADLSDQYSGFWFTFYAGDDWYGVNPYVELRDRYGNIQNGNYQWYNDNDGGLGLRLSFPAPVLLNYYWAVNRIGENKIRLFYSEGNYMEVQLNCNNPEGLQSNLTEILQECNWVIGSVKNQGEKVRRLLGYEFDFQAEGLVNLNSVTTVGSGSWEVVRGSEEGSVLAVSFSEAPELSFEWSLTEFFDNRLSFSSENGSELVLEQECDFSLDAIMEQVVATLMNGTWQMAYYNNGPDVLTAEYVGYAFSFGADHLLEVSKDAISVKTGLWRITRNLEGGLTVYLNLGDDGDLLSELTLDWTLVSISDNRVELKEKGDLDAFSTLVFEK